MWEYLKTDIWKLVKALIVIGLTFLVSWKVIWSTTLVSVDFVTLLSVLLAFFSVSLSAVFYFKATDTSNAFYDNTYKFTQDIAGLLVRIESGFGEKLKNIDDNYGRMRGYIESQNSSGAPVEDLKKDLKSEKEQFNKVLEERDELISQLLAKTGMQDEERENFESLLRGKDDELTKLNREVSRLLGELTVDRVMSRHSIDESLETGVERYIRRSIVRKFFENFTMKSSSRMIVRRFEEIIEQLPGGLVRDMEKLGWLSGGELTDSGVKVIVSAIRDQGE